MVRRGAGRLRPGGAADRSAVPALSGGVSALSGAV